MLKVEIIVVKYNQPEYEADTLKAVAEYTEYPNYDLRAYQNEPGVPLSVCWNRLIEQSDADLICLLNSDTVVTPGWLSIMVNTYNVMGPCAVVPSSNQVFLSQVKIPYGHSVKSWAPILAFAKTCYPNPQVIELPTASAMCVLFSRQDWESAGKFDEEFVLYGEDTEFFYRLAQHTGRPCMWNKEAFVHHYKARSVLKAVENGELDMADLCRKANELCAKKMPDFNISHGPRIPAPSAPSPNGVE